MLLTKEKIYRNRASKYIQALFKSEKFELEDKPPSKKANYRKKIVRTLIRFFTKGFTKSYSLFEKTIIGR